MFASRSNLSSPPHLIWIILLLSSLILNENGGQVAGRTWPRMKSYGKIYSKDALFIANVTSTTTAAPSPVTGERNSLSEINFSRSPGDYKLLNGNVSSSCSHHHQHSNGDDDDDGDNFKLNGSGRWWTNDTNCVAGPFHSSGDVNESVYNALCPSPNGKFPIPGVCGWYAACANGKEFTLNRCVPNRDTFSVEKGRCIQSNATCKDELGNDIEHQTPNEILQQIIKSQKRVGGRGLSLSSNHNNNEHLEESEAILVNHVSQSLDQSSDSDSKPNSPSSGLISSSSQSDLENLCKSTSSHGLHAHPHLCNKYIQCGSAAGTYFVKECGPGTVFNREMLVCDWPANVPECRSSNFQNGNRLEKRSISASPKIIVGDNLRFPISRREKRRANGNGGEKCDGSKKDYISPDPTDCSKYRVCSNSRIVTVTCGQGTLFNPTSGVCDFADEVDCRSRKGDLGAYGCDKGDSYKAPHPEACNKFVECDDGVLAIKSCPPATLYDREAATCDHTSRVTCRKPISFEHDIDVNHKQHQEDDNDEKLRKKKLITKRSIFSRASRSNKLNLACEYNYIAPHPTICNRFVECEDRRIFIKTCGPGTAFNPLIGKCDWPHKVREPDPRDCTKYQQCVRSHYEGRSCGYNQIFDPQQGNCVKATSYEIQQCRLRNTPRTTTPPLPSFVPPPPS